MCAEELKESIRVQLHLVNGLALVSERNLGDPGPFSPSVLHLFTVLLPAECFSSNKGASEAQSFSYMFGIRPFRKGKTSRKCSVERWRAAAHCFHQWNERPDPYQTVQICILVVYKSL